MKGLLRFSEVSSNATPNVPLLILFELKEEIESKLKREVDLIHAPINKDSLIKLNKVVNIYEQ